MATGVMFTVLVVVISASQLGSYTMPDLPTMMNTSTDRALRDDHSPRVRNDTGTTNRLTTITQTVFLLLQPTTRTIHTTLCERPKHLTL